MSPDGSTKSPLPEERLLRLLRGKAARPETDAAALPRPGVAVNAPAAAMTSAGMAARVQQLAWPRLVMTGLGSVLAIEMLVLLIQAVRPLPPLPMPGATVAPAATPAGAEPLSVQIPSITESVSRSLFVAPTAPASGAASVSRAAPSGSAKQLAARLSLLGIIPGNPAQAIIEDSQTKKSYFVSTGQTVVEGAVLDQVLEAHVILDLQGEKVELTL